jgi:hypothetical protein
MGHWFTATGPSAQVELTWLRPCQCYTSSETSVVQNEGGMNTYEAGAGVQARGWSDLVLDRDLEVGILEQRIPNVRIEYAMWYHIITYWARGGQQRAVYGMILEG